MDDQTVKLGRLAQAFCDRIRRGEAPEIEEYAREHPQLASRIRELFSALLFIEKEQSRFGDPSEPASPASVMSLTEGGTFGTYRIEREVGRGGMGVVYEATNLPLNKRVALKVLRTQGPSQAGLVERFLREARTAGSLHHTNIVPVFDVGEIAGAVYYAMQFIEGQGLDQLLGELTSESGRPPDPTTSLPFKITKLLAGDEPPPEARDPAATPATSVKTPPPAMNYFRRVAELGIQAAEGLAYAHERGVIHRDIKPSNLILDDQEVLWITDFGLARRLDDPSLTHTGAILGTPRYMSPEQAASIQTPVDHRTDIYSLGITLYELVTGQPAYGGGTPHEVVMEILLREPATPRSLNPAVPRDLETVILKAIAKRPADRYATAMELADDLRRWLRREPIRARRIGPLGRVVRWCQRNPTLAAVTAAAAVLILLLTGLYYASLLGSMEREREARHEAVRVLAQNVYANAQLVLTSEAPGRRWQSLDFLKQAREIYRRLPRDRAAPGSSESALPTLADLRSQAVAAILTEDAKLARELRCAAGLPPALSGDGRLLVAAWSEGDGSGGGVRLIDVATGKERERWEEPRMAGATRALSPDGSLLATAGLATGREGINLWELPEGRHRETLPVPVPAPWLPLSQVKVDIPSIVRYLCFSPDGGHLVGMAMNPLAMLRVRGTDSPRLLIWNLRKGSTVQVLGSTGAYPAFSGRWIAWPSGEKTVTVRDVRGQEEPVEFQVPSPVAGQTAFHPTDTMLAVVCRIKDTERGFILFHDFHQNAEVDRFSVDLRSPSTALTFSPDGTQLIMGSGDGSIKVLSVTRRETVLELTAAHKAAVTLVLFTSDSRSFLSAGFDGRLNLWQEAPASPLSLVSAHSKTVYRTFAFSPDGRWVAAAPSDEGSAEIHLIRRDEETVHSRLSASVGPEQAGLGLWFRQDSQEVAVVGMRSATAWAAPKGIERFTFDAEAESSKSYPRILLSATYDGDGRLRVAGSDTLSRRVALWDAESGKELWRSPPGLRLIGGSFSRDGRLFAGFGTDQLIVWEIATKREVWKRPLKSEASLPPGSTVTFSPDGRWLVTLPPQAAPEYVLREPGTEGAPAVVWNASAGTMHLEIEGPSPVRTADIHSGGTILALGYGDGTIELWDLDTTTKLLRWQAHLHPVRHLAFTPDGASLASCDGRSPIQLLRLPNLRRQLAAIDLDW